MDNNKRRKIALLPNVVTAFGLSCGLFVIFKMAMIGLGDVSYDVLTMATGILLLAAFADLLDGAIARVIKAESDFGSIFDTLADAISFGVAPSVVVLKSLAISPMSSLYLLVTISSIIFSLCGVLRLVRFNVLSLASKGDVDLALAHKKHFTGLPIPAAAAAIISLNLFFFSEGFQHYVAPSPSTATWTLSIAQIFLGYCMISRWKFPSIKTLEIRVRSFQIVFLTAIVAGLIFFGILHYFALVFLLVSWSYVFLASILAIIRLLAGRKSKTLEEFEPDPDELDDEDELSD